MLYCIMKLRKDPDMACVLIWGDPATGFHLIGPFESTLHATDYAHGHERLNVWTEDAWWIMPIHDVAEDWQPRVKTDTKGKPICLFCGQPDDRVLPDQNFLPLGKPKSRVRVRSPRVDAPSDPSSLKERTEEDGA